MLEEKKPHIGITIGDINGIGPEIILKTLSIADLSKSIPVVFAPSGVLEHYNRELSLNCNITVVDETPSLQENTIHVYPLPDSPLKITTGSLTREGGKAAMLSIDEAIRHTMRGLTDAIVTAPISKEAVNLAGYNIPGHTEYLAKHTHTDTVVMMLVNKKLRVALATTHVPVKDIVADLNPELLTSKIRVLHKSLTLKFGISNPKIAVFGLNPHAGDGGVIGLEEIELIQPVIEKLNHEGLNLHGPFPADGFFGQKLHKEFNAIFAMYHDQGLVPFKLLSFGKGVNFTAGLPIIRTSPDHGTAYDIAGKGVANPSSFKEAYNLAVHLAQKRINGK
ncbi:MAG: 4-hydroxythreonine-4-phosphate dehydrogenase PdxA [Balneolaceae bacterium]|nr:4-hydroxythreonine-4-phosphate dehydrogenase PdxA [Balneolaceae bacterium]